MINFTNMYIITFVHYIGIFFSVPCKHEMCKYKYNNIIPNFLHDIIQFSLLTPISIKSFPVLVLFTPIFFQVLCLGYLMNSLFWFV